MLSSLPALLFASLAWPIQAQETPPIACPNYFQYLSIGDQFIGKITLPSPPQSFVKLDVNFSQRQPAQNNYYGKISLYDSEDATINNMLNGQPISYRVDFPFPNILPKLTGIVVNGQIVCSASDYPPPSTKISLHHMLQAGTTTFLHSQNNNVRLPVYTTNTIVGPVHRPNTQNIYYYQSNFPVFQSNPFLPKPSQVPIQPQVQTRPPTPQRPQTQVISQRQPETIVQTCGREGTTAYSPFVYGGTVLTRGQFPWLTAIYKKVSEGLVFICGGSLLSANTVITAAHCFRLTSLTAERVLVYLGRYDLDNYGEDGAVNRELSRLLIHPEYDWNTYPDADLAILHLKSPVTFSQYIQPVCLWTESSESNLIKGIKAFVAGWGADEIGRAVSPLPKMVDVNIAGDVECVQSQTAFSSLSAPRIICAGNRDGTGPCMGDSGGGLLINRNGRWVLRGIVSAGMTLKKTCNLREYVVYCDLAKHISWVQSNIV